MEVEGMVELCCSGENLPGVGDFKVQFIFGLNVMSASIPL